MDSNQIDDTENTSTHRGEMSGYEHYYHDDGSLDEPDYDDDWDSDAWAWAEFWRWGYSAEMWALWRDKGYTLRDKLTITASRMRSAFVRWRWKWTGRLDRLLGHPDDPNDLPF